MEKFAQVTGNTVTAIFDEYVEGAIPVTGGVAVGWLFDRLTFTPPPPILIEPILTLAEKQQLVWSAIKAKRDSLVQSGGYKVNDKWFHSDTFSRTQQMSLVMFGENLPSGIQWRTMDGSFVTITPELANKIFIAASASDQAMFTAAEAKHTDMLKLEDPSTYDINSGWPVVYTE